MNGIFAGFCLYLFPLFPFFPFPLSKLFVITEYFHRKFAFLFLFLSPVFLTLDKFCLISNALVFEHLLLRRVV